MSDLEENLSILHARTEKIGSEELQGKITNAVNTIATLAITFSSVSNILPR